MKESLIELYLSGDTVAYRRVITLSITDAMVAFEDVVGDSFLHDKTQMLSRATKSRGVFIIIQK